MLVLRGEFSVGTAHVNSLFFRDMRWGGREWEGGVSSLFQGAQEGRATLVAVNASEKRKLHFLQKSGNGKR